MAKGRQKESILTSEEKLAQALVVEGEQPYKVPENWCWTTIEKVATVVTGGTPSKKHSEYYDGTFPFYKPSDLDAGRYVFEASECIYLMKEKRCLELFPKTQQQYVVSVPLGSVDTSHEMEQPISK